MLKPGSAHSLFFQMNIIDKSFLVSPERYRAAAALIPGRTGQVANAHQGGSSEFASLTRVDPQVDRLLFEVLAQSYGLKSIAAYGTGR
jgi:hypothetical protein